jgi:hypothetical protein
MVLPELVIRAEDTVAARALGVEIAVVDVHEDVLK